MHPKKAVSSKFLMIRILKGRDLIQKEITKLRSLDFTEMAGIQPFHQILICYQIEIIQVKLKLILQK